MAADNDVDKWWYPRKESAIWISEVMLCTGCMLEGYCEVSLCFASL